MKNIVFRIFPICFTLLLGACATTPFPALQSPISQNSAVLNLHATALDSARSGSLDHAISTLERALRIEPHNARLWFDLAKMHKQAGEAEPAKNMALRAANLSDSLWLSSEIESFIHRLSI